VTSAATSARNAIALAVATLAAVFAYAPGAIAAEPAPATGPNTTLPPAPARAPAPAPEHVPPDPPKSPLGSMSAREMSRMMEMDDTRLFGTVIFDQLEWRDGGVGSDAAWDAEGWYGGDYNKLWIKTEGEYSDGARRQTGHTGQSGQIGQTDHASSSLAASVDLLWDRIISRWWNVQAGLRQDFGDGPARTWGALGLEGLAPYGFDTQATLYLGEKGRSALRIKAEYDLYLTQRLIVQPKIEANAYGRADSQRNVGAGLSNAGLGVRLRYEFRREFAPYVGLDWSRAFGSTATLIRDQGRDADDLQVVAGLRAWL
jgi:copper resistance protein B